MSGPGLIEMLAQVPKEPHNIAISARISHLFYFPICLLSISASLVPPANEVVFVGLKDRLMSLMNMRPFWRLLQMQGAVDHLSAHLYLASNGSDTHLFDMQFLNLGVSCDALLMELEAFYFLILPQTSLPGCELLCLLLRKVL